MMDPPDPGRALPVDPALRPAVRRRRITHLFLDAGNTIVYPDMERVARALVRRGARVSAGALRRGELKARLRVDDPALIGRSTDDSRWDFYFIETFRACGIHRKRIIEPALRELRAYHAEQNLWDFVPPGMAMLLDRLRRRARLSIISNSNGTLKEKLVRIGLAPYFDVVLDSRVEGVEKPDPRLFRIALDRTRAHADRSLHVGDLYHVDVTGARAAGMHAALLDPGDLHGDKQVRRFAQLDGVAEYLER